MADITDAIHELHSLCSDVRQITPYVLEAISSLESALQSLCGLNDQHARNAEAEIRSAMVELRNAHATWMDDYTRRADDLAHRLAS